MRTTTAAVLLAVLALAGCGGGDDPAPAATATTAAADVAACETAMREQFASGMESLAAGQDAPEGERPDECEGVSDADLEEIAGRILAGS